MNDYLIHLRSNPDFAKVIEDLKRERPAIPAHDCTQDNTEIWKDLSAQQRGFDLCLYLLTGG